MAFSYETKKVSVIGNLRLVIGSYTNGASDTGGAIKTGLNEIKYFNANTEVSQSTTANLVALSGGTATITTVANEDGHWIAIGV